MIRRVFKMKLKPGCAAEYKKRHDELWPELAQAMKDAGVLEYSIFLDEETSTLIAFQTLTDDNTIAALRQTEIMRKWWRHLADIMVVGDDQSPVVQPLRQVFDLES